LMSAHRNRSPSSTVDKGQMLLVGVLSSHLIVLF